VPDTAPKTGFPRMSAQEFKVLLKGVTLTPGDFQQLYRRARLFNPQTADEFFNLFEDLCSSKLPAHPIGFLKSA